MRGAPLRHGATEVQSVPMKRNRIKREAGLGGELESALIRFEFELSTERQHPADVEEDGEGEASYARNGEEFGEARNATPKGHVGMRTVRHRPSHRQSSSQQPGFADSFHEAKVFSVFADDVTEFVAEHVGELSVVFDQPKIEGTHPNVARSRHHEAKQHGQRFVNHLYSPIVIDHEIDVWVAILKLGKHARSPSGLGERNTKKKPEINRGNHC